MSSSWKMFLVSVVALCALVIGLAAAAGVSQTAGKPAKQTTVKTKPATKPAETQLGP